MPTPIKPKAPAPRPHLPAQAVQVGPGRYRVDGRDAKRMYRRFFTGPNAEKDAKAHAAQLNAAPKPGPAAGAKLGGPLGAILVAHRQLKAKQEATAKAKAAAAQKASVGQFAAMHQQAAIKALDELTPTSSRDAVISAIAQCEAGGIPQARVEAVLKSRGFDQNKLGAMVRTLQAETARA